SRVRSCSFAGFNDWSGERVAFVQLEAEGHVEGAFDTVDADFAVALGRMAVAATEEGAGVVDRKIQCGSSAELAHIEIATESAGRPRTKAAFFGARHAHDAEKRAYGNDSRRKGARRVAFEEPMEETGVVETLLEKAEAFYDAGPSPPTVTGCEDVDLQNVSGLGAVDPDRPGEGVNPRAIDPEVFGESHAGRNLGTAGVDALDLDLVARRYAQAWCERAVPEGVGWICSQAVFSHASF